MHSKELNRTKETKGVMMTLLQAKQEMIKLGFVATYAMSLKSKVGVKKDLNASLKGLREHLQWNENKLATQWGTIEKDIVGNEVKGSYKAPTNNDNELCKRAIAEVKKSIKQYNELLERLA